MDIMTGTALAKTAVDLAKNENVLNKTAGIAGMLFPYVGITKRAVDMYISEIEKSSMTTEVKMFSILNTKQTLKKIKNQKSIAEIAIENAKEGTDFSEKSEVNEEWLDRFMDSAGFVSAEDIQLIWGKILANEFEQPGSTPPNMIRILSEITPDLAMAFRNICSMIVWMWPLKEDGSIEKSLKKVIVPYTNNDDKFGELGLSFNVLNELESLGLIKFETLTGYINKGITNDKILLCVSDKLELIEEYKKGEIPIGNVILTSAGRSLQEIIDLNEIDEYYEMIKNYLSAGKVKFAEEHDFVVTVKGDEPIIDRKNP